MAGLLDFIKTPEGQGLLGMVAGYAANAQKGAPVNSVGRGLGAGLLAYNGAQQFQDKSSQEAQERELRAMQIAQMKRQVADQNLADETAKQYFTPAVPGSMGGANLPPELQTGAVPMAGKPASFDLNGYAQARMAQNPTAGMALMQSLQKETPFNKVDAKDFTPESVAKFAQTRNYGDLVPVANVQIAPNGVAYDPRRTAPGSVFSDPNKPFGPNGPNAAVQAYELSKARAGATSVKIENKMGEGIAKEIGPMLRESLTAANGAAQTIDAANRITSAIDSDKVFAGPGANVRLKMAQVSQMLGVGGKDEAEKIANTRQAIRGLSEMTLKGRQQMSGQGAITNQESALAERAMSGDISDLTVPEIKMLAAASARAARFVYDQHQESVRNVASDPATAGLARFYKPLPLPTSPLRPVSPTSAPAAGAGVRFLGFE